ncbi:MAG: NADH-quinone oxidoreductase subunit NuoE [Oscillospiraceae bacterium]|nr:NADH-quinone oxidoreductase subunit NuoE [Oscillospiraceae bacterium]
MELLVDLQQKTSATLQKYPEPKDALISVLQDVQEVFGYLPEDALRCIAAETGIAASQLTGVASFYAQFRMEKPGKYQIMVCMGTACHVNKGERVADAVREFTGVEEGETTPDGLFSWEEVACLGCCSLSPVMMINGTAYGKLDKDKVKKIINDLRNAEKGGEGACVCS